MSEHPRRVSWMFCYTPMNKNKQKRNRPDYDGNERGIFAHNKAILRKTATVCALCGMPLDKSLKYPHPLSISIDHIIPVALGGTSTIDNLQATHLICNKEKGKKLLNLPKNDKKCSNLQENNQNSAKIEQNNKRNQKNIPQYIDWSRY